MDQSSFTSYVGMGCNEIKELIINKYSLLSDKLSGKLEQQEIDNQGYLLWNCKMILRNIYMSCDKLTSKFNSELTRKLIDTYSKISNLIKEDEATWTSIENIKNTFEKIKTEFEVLNILSNEKESNESGFIRKTMLDENGMEYEVEEKFALPNFKQTKWLDKIAEKLQMSLVDLSSNEKRLDEANATYYWNSSRGGTSLIVSDDGSYLGATSSVNFDELLEEFKSGRRNGNFAETNENNIEKKKSILSEIIKNIYSNHQEFVMKPPAYESPSKFFLVENENQVYVATILDKHIMNYPNSQIDNSQNNNYPTNILVYNLDNNESSIYTYEDICKKYTFDFNSIDIKELLQKKSNITSLELIELKRSLASILDEIIQNKEFINIEKYISEYLPKFLLTLSEKEIHLLIDGLSKKDDNKEFKINCRFCNNEIVIDSSKLPTNIKALDTMCPNCKSFIKYGNPNYVEKIEKSTGWDDIEKKLSTIYPNQEPLHYGTLIKYSLGGKDPLDGISIYDSGDYYHFVTFGFSEIYEKENDNKDLSGFGFELTFKLKKNNNINENELKCFAGVLQGLARYVFETKRGFKPYEYIYSGQAEGIDLAQKSEIVGFVTIEDPQLKTIDTINGKVQFIELVGATNQELSQILNKEMSKEDVINNIIYTYSDVTDYDRKIVNKTECKHKWELTDKVPEISKEWQQNSDGTKKEVYYGIYKCSTCAKEERLEIKDDISDSNNDDLKNILDNIFSKLTGENSKDTDYLNKISEEYKFHPMSKEISREIGRKIFELLPNDKKEEFTKKYDEDINDIHVMLDEANLYIFGKYKDLDKAKSMLLEFVDGNMIFDNDSTTEYYNFSDVIEFVIYTKTNKTNKNIKWLDIPFVTAYSYLSYIYNEEKQYDKALEMIEKACRWNPMSLSPLFEKCETYKMQKDWDNFYNITLSLYDKIYNARDLAHYYRNLGFYYIEKGNLNIAYALYTASTKFEKNNNAYAEMKYINQLLQREFYNMSAEEGVNLLKQNNISFGVKQENLDLLVAIYVNEKELISNPRVESILSTRIYELTFDKKFAPFKEVVDKTTNCSIIVPKIWKELPVESRTKQTMFAYNTEQNVLLQAIYGGKCKIENFDDAYNIEINQIKSMPNTEILKQNELELKLKQGIKKFKLALAEYLTADGKKIRILHAFTLINDRVVDFTIPVNPNINHNNDQAFNSQLNVRNLINVLLSIYEFSKDKTKNISNSIKQDPVLKEKMLDKIDNAIIHLTEQQFEEINTYYKNNKDIRKVFDFANETFKKATEEDVFWIVSSKEALIYIMVNILEEKGILKYNDLREILSNKDNFINICKNINANNEDKEYLRIVEHIKKATDNMLDSYYDIIKKYLKIVTPKEETVIYNLKFSNDSSVEITVPKKLGEFTHPTETSYKIGNDITVMNAKCNNVDLLKKRANEWLINSAKTNNQVLHDDLDKEYTLKNKSISVVEKVVSKDNKKRYYKFAYYDENMLMFGYNNDDLSNTINDIIISMKSKKEQVKVLRNPFEDPSDKTNGNDLSLINVLVEKIKNMNDGESSSISKLLENKIDGINLFDIQKEVISKLNELDIELDYSKHDGKVTGLPFNLDFIKKSKNNNLQFNLKIEHTPFHGTYGKLDELTVPQPIIEEYKVIEGLKIDLKDFKIEVLKINGNGIEIKVYDNKGILSSNNESSDIIVDYKNGDSIGSITLGKEIKLYKDVFDAGEYWNIYLYN